MTSLVEIRRYEYGVNGTLGELWVSGNMVCHTLEDPDNNNERGISCIPEGTYQVKPHSGPKFKNVWEIDNVPNRDDILIHAGNTMENTRGCVLVGSKTGTIRGLPAVLESRLTLDKLRTILPQNFLLTIRSD